MSIVEVIDKLLSMPTLVLRRSSAQAAVLFFCVSFFLWEGDLSGYCYPVFLDTNNSVYV